MTTDLLVVGGGVAGTAVAAEATARGASVTVLEADDHLGGSGWLSAGIFWTAPDLETFRRICPDGDIELGRTLVEGFDEAVERVRAEGIEVSDRWHGQMGFGVAHRIDIHGLLGLWQRRIEANGEIRFQSRAERLLIEDGAVRGAVASGPGGSEEIRAAATVLATGGFQGDHDRIRELIGPGADEMLLRSNPHSRGDGLRFGLEAGGAESGSLDSFYGHLIPYPLRDFPSEDYLPLTQYHSKACILVNFFGRRFTDESRGDEVSNQATLRQPGARAVLIFDERVRREHAVGPPYPHGQEIDRLEIAASRGARIAEARSLDELVETLTGWGVNGPRLRRTLVDYEAAAEGAEVRLDVPLPPAPEPLREPPFHAVEVQPSITFTFGGLQTDTEGRVLDPGSQPVPGLYAAGADIGGMQDTGYVGGLVLGVVFAPRIAAAALENHRQEV